MPGQWIATRRGRVFLGLPAAGSPSGQQAQCHLVQERERLSPHSMVWKDICCFAAMTAAAAVEFAPAGSMKTLTRSIPKKVFEI